MKFISFILFLFSMPCFGVDALPKAVAMERSKAIENVNYSLYFEFTKESQDMKATGTVSFNLDKSRLKGPLRIDLNAKLLETVSLNGVALKQFEKGDGYFSLPLSLLKDKNQVVVRYVTGPKIKHIRRFYDEIDRSHYFYTSLQANGAHYLYPGFDQPDIRGEFEVSVKAPAEWNVISNEPAVEKKVEGATALWKFGKTPPLSPYLVFVGAGNYVQFQDKWGKVGMSLYVRKSLAGKLDSKTIFADTKKGLEFYQDYFSYPYPYTKYDQIFVPDSANAGMENPGAVTLTERFIPLAEPNKTFITARNNLIYHEIVHMWFGNLVAMKWWDELWLNESFASYFASFGIESVFKDESSWISDFTNRGYGYLEDISPESSHPIIANVPDNSSADGAFDGIAYNKGSTFVNQLHFLVGNEAFRKGIRNYFRKFAGKNTTKDDFIEAIDDVSDVDVAQMSKTWLETSGRNKIAVNFSCKKDLLKNLVITQEKNFSDSFLPARIAIGFFKKQDGKLTRWFEELVTLTGEQTHVVLKDRPCPDFVQPDVGGHHYAKFILDEKSLRLSALAATSLPSALDRFQLWRNLEDSLKEGKISADAYLKVMSFALANESNPETLALASGWLDRRAVPFKDVFDMYFTKEEKHKFASVVEPLLLKRLQQSSLNSELRREVFRMLAYVARSETLRKMFSDFISGKDVFSVQLDYETKWVALQSLARMKDPKILGILEEERKNDPGLETWKNVMLAKSLYPDPEVKKSLWPRMLESLSIPYYVARSISENIHNGEYPELSGPYLEPFFKKISMIDWANAVPALDMHFYRLFPVQVCSPEALALSRRYLENMKNLNQLASRKWHRAQAELAQCVKVRHPSKNF